MLYNTLIYRKKWDLIFLPIKKYFNQQIEITLLKRDLSKSLQPIHITPSLTISTQITHPKDLPSMQLCNVIKFSLLFLHYVFDLEFILVFKNY